MARFALLALLVGCSFDKAKLAVDAATGEMPVPDAGPCSELGVTCAGTELRRCTVVGAQPSIEQCAWSCLDGPPPHCGELEPAGGALLSTDFETSALADVTFPIGAIVDTDNGRIGTSVNGTSVRSPGTGVINGIDFQIRANVAVFRMQSLMMSGGVQVIGSEAIAIVTGGEIRIRGIVDLRGPCSGPNPGPGGFAGGGPSASGVGNGGGAGGQQDRGGGGGGHGGIGGNGGGGTVGGPIFGDAAISLLAGGGGGGGGGGVSGGTGGGGGGAIQLVSSTRVVIEAIGGINAGGCAGTGGSSGGAGGGAGGTILIEAPVVEIAGAMAVNGGGGGGNNNDGLDATLNRVRAAGGNASAGDGAAGAVLGGGSAGNEAGGGGGIGRMRVHTRDGVASITGVLSPSPTDANTTCTVAPAKLK